MMILGAVLAAVYLASRSIWIVAMVHAGSDVLGFVVRPAIIRLLRAGRTDVAVELR